MVFSLANKDLLGFLENYKKSNMVSNMRYINSFVGYCIDTTVLIIYWVNVLVILVSFLVYVITKHNSVIECVTKQLYNIVLYLCSKVLTIVNSYAEDFSYKKIITMRKDQTPCLERFYLFLRNRDTFFFNIFLHRFLNSDQDDIHDHPWGFFHIVISGGYWEYITVNEDGTTLDQGVKKVWRSPGYYNIVSSQYKHRIVLSDEKPWTLFIPFERHGTWNFWIPLVWKNGEPCKEGDINDDTVLKSTKWKYVPHYLYKK